MSPPLSAGVKCAARRLVGAVVVVILAALGGASLAHAWEFDIAEPTIAFRDGTPGVDTDIWLYDLGTRKYTRATNTPENAEQALAVAGRRVYFLRSGTPAALDAYDLTSNRLEQDVADFDWIDTNGPSADAGHVVFAASQSTGFSPQAAYLIDDLPNAPPEQVSPFEPETLLTPTVGDCARTPDIDYPWVVWLDNERGECNNLPGWLYARNLETGVTKVVAAPFCFCAAGFQVSDGKVAIIETEGGHRVLVLYDLTTGARTVLSLPDEPSSALLSDFRGSRIVYSASGPRIYDLATDQVTAVATPGYGEPPISPPARLSGNWVVYQESGGKLVAKNLQSGEERVIRPRPSDRDGDGFSDEDDRCPDVFGIAPLGCPAAEPSSPSPSPPSPPLTPPPLSPSRDFKVRAIGDSVTAGFGYHADGTRIRNFAETLKCRPPSPPDNRCSSPDLVAYPAVWARMHGINTFDRSEFRNSAVSGASPTDWLSGPFTPVLRRTIQEDPDVILLTLGANPLLTEMAFGESSLFEYQICMRSDISGNKTHACVLRGLDRYNVVPNLTHLYRRLALNTNAHIGVLLYHQTRPNTIPADKSHILFTALNAAVASAFTKARQSVPVGRRSHLQLIDPGPFAQHGCRSGDPWVLPVGVDLCIHPNIAGHRAFARAIDKKFGSLVP